MRGTVRAAGDEPEAGDYVPEMRERETYDTAFGFCYAIKRRQIFRRAPILDVCVLWRRVRVHPADLRLPLIHEKYFPAV
jgi:hypothetical protein